MTDGKNYQMTDGPAQGTVSLILTHAFSFSLHRFIPPDYQAGSGQQVVQLYSHFKSLCPA